MGGKGQGGEPPVPALAADLPCSAPRSRGIQGGMKWYRAILGGIVALGLALPVAAEGPGGEMRPLLRADAAALRLAEHRPRLRPAYMLRYPVRIETRPPVLRPIPRPLIPRARWDHRGDSQSWTWAAMSALAGHGDRLEQTVPRDIDNWCPGYAANGPRERRAFWVGMMSALSKHESTYRPEAVGGGGLWFGLLQIYPDTAQRYGCRARTGTALKDPEDNLACAIRIMNVTVPRDNAIAVHDGRWRGVAADWGPMTNRAKIADMAAWTRAQEYCRPDYAVARSLRPIPRPTDSPVLSTMNLD